LVFAPKQHIGTQNGFSLPVLAGTQIIPTLEHSPYCLDLALCDLKLKSMLKGTHLQSVEDSHKKTAETLKSDFRGCFKAWMACMGQCVASNSEEEEEEEEELSTTYSL